MANLGLHVDFHLVVLIVSVILLTSLSGFMSFVLF